MYATYSAQDQQTLQLMRRKDSTFVHNFSNAEILMCSIFKINI